MFKNFKHLSFKATCRYQDTRGKIVNLWKVINETIRPFLLEQVIFIEGYRYIDE